MLDFERDKLLIIHMDDIGMSYAANQAAMDLYEKGTVTSGSVMLPCAWAYDFVMWSRKHPQYDIGIHLTFTCEWEAGRWRPFGSHGEVPGLYDEMGFMWRGMNGELNNLPQQQFKRELELQLEQADRWGLNYSHIDNHMFVIGANPEFFRIYLDVANTYGIVPHIPDWILFNETMKNEFKKSGFRKIDDYVSIVECENSYDEKKIALYKAIKAIKPGLNVLTIHPVIETPEIKVIIPGWEERNIEYKLFMEDETAKLIRENDIKLISWKDILTLV